MSALVFVVDDSPTVRKLVEITLRREGYDALSFADGVELLQARAARHLPRVPDLLLLDLTMPKMDGYQLARHLRAQADWQSVALVVLTRHNGVVDRLKARLMGARGYLTKPFTTQQVLLAVATALGLSEQEHTPSTSARQ
jgi:twitching motility two-component system response regulator PilG